MNKANILAVADAIEQHSIPDLGFNMAYWGAPVTAGYPDMSGQNCGTVACVAGWAAHLSTGRLVIDDDEDVAAIAAVFLGLDRDSSSALFAPNTETVNWRTWQDIEPTKAVEVLRHLAETGEVDWSVGAPVEAA